jgi:hypothetical protein
MKKKKKEIEIVDPVSSEMERLTVLFDNIDPDKKNLCKNLIQNAAFMSVSLQKLQEDLNESGWVEEYQNGENQCGRKPSSTAQIYNKLISNYNNVIKQLIGLLPNNEKELAKDAVDPMTSFLMDK